MVTWCTLMNGPETERRTGKSVWRQLVEQIDTAVRHSIPPPWYYMFGLWDDQRRQLAALYLNRYETKNGIYGLLKSYFGRAPSIGGSLHGLGDKLEFHELCLKRDLPTPPLVMVVDSGRITGGGPRLPEVDLFVKPRKGRGGNGAESWSYLGDGRYRSHANEECTAAELLDRIARRSLEPDPQDRRHGGLLERVMRLFRPLAPQPRLVQRRLFNHPDLADLTTGALMTARMMTARDENGGYEFTNAVFRTPVRRSCPVDNFHAGGIAAPVDPRTGELGPAVGGGLRGLPRLSDLGPCETHPVTGARIAGRRLPYWREAVALVTRIHESFPGLPIVGWDVAFTKDGPVIIEGNGSPDLDIIQCANRQPLGQSRLAALLAFHVRRALASLPPPA
jgi:hypothetical protein